MSISISKKSKFGMDIDFEIPKMPKSNVEEESARIDKKFQELMEEGKKALDSLNQSKNRMKLLHLHKTVLE